MLWMQTFACESGDYQVKLALRLQNMAAPSKAEKKRKVRKVHSSQGFDAFDAWPPILFTNRRSAAAFGRSGQPQRKRRWESEFDRFDRFDCVEVSTPGEVLGGINHALKLRECWNVSQKTGKKWKELASEKFGNRILGSLWYVEICVNLGQQSIVESSHDIGTSFCDAISTQISKHHKNQKLFVLEISESFELSAGLLFHQEIDTHDSVPSVRRSASRHHAMPTYAIDGGAEIAVTRHDPAQNNHSEIFKWWFVHVCMMDGSWWFHLLSGDTVTQSALRNQPHPDESSTNKPTRDQVSHRRSNTLLVLAIFKNIVRILVDI